MQLLFNLLPLIHIFTIFFIETKGLHHVNAEHVTGSQSFQGRYSRNVRSYEITIPRKVNPDGTFKSFSLPHFYERNYDYRRRRRSDGATEDEDVIHYALNFNNRLHHLELQPNHGLLSPGMVIERKRGVRELSDVDLRSANETQCHYLGSVRGDPLSRVALSVCDGLAGHISSSTGRFFVEPVSDASPETDGRHLHMVHRQAPAEILHLPSLKCQTTDDWQRAWTDRYRREYKNGSAWTGEFRRSTSEHYYLELCVVADKKFLDHHKEGDVETYILTIMNMVSDFYHDASVGNMIDVVIVRIVMLEKEKEEMDLSISQNASKTLESFSAWAKRVNPASHQHPNHHDIAVLLTRHDLCAENSNTECSLLGLAYVATACNAERAACINEDKGLVLASTVTHEVGHVMGCSHDSEEVSGCKPLAPDKSGHVMSPYVNQHTTVWSACSKRFITDYLDNGLGECLLDEPLDQPFKKPQMPLGALYDADHQCRILFGDHSKACSNEEVDCKQLWCVTTPGNCGSYSNPPAEGTSCGADKWCYNLECVKIGQRPGAVNGGWGSWGSWSACSRTCGAGVAWRERPCNKPTPKHLGRYCVGERRKYKTCNTKPCPTSTMTFREKQCKERNTKPFNEKYFKWKPFTKEGGNPCSLICINEQNTYAELEPRIKDGTPCKPGTRDLCIAGTCKHVGCDWNLESGAEFDQCGICRGTGTECDHIKGTYKKTGHDYVQVIKIPPDAHNVHIMERAPSENTIAVSATGGKKFYLNGNHHEQVDGQYTFGKNTLGIYSHPEKDKEELKIFGPTSEELIIYAVFYSGGKYPGLDYEYWKKSSKRNANSTSAAGSYKWEFLDWEECSVRCGGGAQISEASCVEDVGGKVSPSYCSELPKPKPESRTCNEKPCTNHWSVGEWCHCKGGRHSRQVRCVMEAPHWDADDIEVPENQCKEKKPCSSEKCDEKSEKTCPVKEPSTTTCPDETSTTCPGGDSSDNAEENPAVTECDVSKADAAENDVSKGAAGEAECDVSKAASVENEVGKAAAGECDVSKAAAADCDVSKTATAENDACNAAATESASIELCGSSGATATEGDVSKLQASNEALSSAISDASNVAEANISPSAACLETCSDNNKDASITKTHPCDTDTCPDISNLLPSVIEPSACVSNLSLMGNDKILSEGSLPPFNSLNTGTLDSANSTLTLSTRNDKPKMDPLGSHTVPQDKTEELIKEIDETFRIFNQDGMLPVSIKIDNGNQGTTQYSGFKEDKIIPLFPKQGRSTNLIKDKIIRKETNYLERNPDNNNENNVNIEVTSIGIDRTDIVIPLESSDVTDVQSLVTEREVFPAEVSSNKYNQDLTKGVTLHPDSLVEPSTKDRTAIKREKGFKELFGRDDESSPQTEKSDKERDLETDDVSEVTDKSQRHTSMSNGHESFELFPKDNSATEEASHVINNNVRHKLHSNNTSSHSEEKTPLKKRSRKGKKRRKSSKLKKKNIGTKRKSNRRNRKRDKATVGDGVEKKHCKGANAEDACGTTAATTTECGHNQSRDHKLRTNEEVQDRESPDTLTVVEVPIVEVDGAKCNRSRVMSDEAEEEMGDPETVILDTKHPKIYHGKAAMDKIKEIERLATKKPNA